MASLLDLFSRKKVCTLLTNVEGAVVEKYEHFKDFLDCNKESLNLIATLEQLYYGGGPVNLAAVKEKFTTLLTATRNLVGALNGLSEGKYPGLLAVVDRVAAEAEVLWRTAAPREDVPLVLLLEAITPDMIPVAGGKATNLATVKNTLEAPTPPGFVITARGAFLFIAENRLQDVIETTLAGFSPESPAAMEASSAALQNRLRQATIPTVLADEIFRAYEAMTAAGGEVRLAMRSSAVGEDTAASFAGQYTTVLNVGREGLLEAYKEVLASKYNPWAIAYRLRYGLSDQETPMCVAGIVMVEAAASGVLYTRDPGRPDSGQLKITSLWGLGEQLVGGQAAPDVFWVDRQTGEIRERRINRKPWRLVNLPQGGTRLEPVSDTDQDRSCLNDATIQTLADWGLKFETHFGGPQDVEWAVDDQGRLFFLQSRPLGISDPRRQQLEERRVFTGYPLRLQGGVPAAPGATVGRVFSATGPNRTEPPADAILVTRTATPDYAAFIGQVRGIIAEVGSTASHLASVAREFGVPALFNATGALSTLTDGEEITLVADTATVYGGKIPEVEAASHSPRKFIVDSPAHRRLRTLLDLAAPLNLTDTQSRDFSPAGCQTLHDVIRFAHETSMREMFALSSQPERGLITSRLQSNIPLSLYLIDLGGGLRFGVTTCDQITVDHLESIPLKALWRGFTHPGITWKGAINFDLRNFMTLMAQGATREAAGGQPGGDSYALISQEYLNLSAKFGYHFANLDALVTATPDQNHVTLQFSGGVGTVYGRSLRLAFLANVLTRLGYQVTVTGDILEGSLHGLEATTLGEVLDQTGRLLASSRLLDMAINDKADVERLTESFFAGNYNFLSQSPEERLPDYYIHDGDWRLVGENDTSIIFQDGTTYRSTLGSGLATVMGKVMGHKYLEFLDSIGAYFYFPLAIAKESYVENGRLTVQVQLVEGKIDQAGGLAFGIRNVGNYFVLRINALEGNLMLFEFVNNRRHERAKAPLLLERDRWYEIEVEVTHRRIKGSVDGELLIDYEAERPLDGYVGLWTKADSVTRFARLQMETAVGERQFS